MIWPLTREDQGGKKRGKAGEILSPPPAAEDGFASQWERGEKQRRKMRREEQEKNGEGKKGG